MSLDLFPNLLKLRSKVKNKLLFDIKVYNDARFALNDTVLFNDALEYELISKKEYDIIKTYIQMWKDQENYKPDEVKIVASEIENITNNI